MWTSADEYCEQQWLEAKENDIEEVRKERDSLKRYAEKVNKQLEEIKTMLDYIHYEPPKGEIGMEYHVYKYQRDIQDTINHITNPLVYPKKPDNYKR